jgi:hypothetical protein
MRLGKHIRVWLVGLGLLFVALLVIGVYLWWKGEILILQGVLSHQVKGNITGSEMINRAPQQEGVYYATGVVGGLIKEPFNLYSTTSKKLGTSKLAYKHIYLDQQEKLAMRVVPVVMVDSGGDILPLVGDWKSMVANAGLSPDVDGLIKYYEGKLEMGRMISYGFFDSVSDLDLYLKFVEKRKGSPVDLGSALGKTLSFERQYLDGRTGVADTMLRGKENGNVVVPLGFSSLMYGQREMLSMSKGSIFVINLLWRK